MTQNLSRANPHRSADLALSVWLGPLATGRRVLWIGDPGDAAERLASMADEVRVLDTSGRGRRRRGGVARVALYQPGPLAIEGRFDLAVVPDVTAFEEPGARFEELAQALGDGTLVVGAPADREDAYAAIRDHLASSFREVRVVGQAGFDGLAFADLGAEVATDVVLDGALVHGRDAGEMVRVYGIAADELPSLDAYLLVQIPAELRFDVTAVDAEAPEGVDGLEDALAARSREVEALRDALERAESRLEQAQARIVAMEGELAEARATLKHADGADRAEAGEIARLERKLRDRGRALRAAEAERRRRERVFRAAVEELGEHQRGRRGGQMGPLLEAEAARAEAELTNHELQARLLASEDALAALQVREAELEGRVRGLRARAAEQRELREVAEARMRLVELDLEDRREAVRRLENEAADLREALDVARIRAGGAGALEGGVEETEDRAGEVRASDDDAGQVDEALARRVEELEDSERRLSARVGRLSGQLMAARGSLADLEEERDRARVETLRLTAQLSALEGRMEGLRLGYETRIAMLAEERSEVAPTGTDEAIERELARVSVELRELRGEREGLRMRLADREAALEALQARAGTEERAEEERTAELDAADRLRAELSELRAAHGNMTLRLADLEEERAKAQARADDLTQALAARDALVTRLQVDLAEEEQVARKNDLELDRARDEAKRLREAVVDASRAVDEKEAAERKLEELKGALATAEQRAAEAEALREERDQLQELTARAEEAEALETERDALREERDTLRAALEAAEAKAQADTLEAIDAAEKARREAMETVQGLEAKLASREGALETLRELRALLDGWRVEEDGAPREKSEITAVGVEAPAEGEGGLARLEREVADKDTLLRSLTAQLEERNDRIRALERRLAEGGVSGDAEELQRELMELQERVTRLNDELSQERTARDEAEAQLDEVARQPDADEELERLRKALRDREAALDEAESRASVFERDVGSLRGVVQQARAGLEALLGDATSSGDPATADRIGELLSVLGRFG
ncbi:MAG: hypothetical protein CMN29_05435 [Sandaracinus sp.]|nr:hypothetical protein [Sandaracinus sp.]